MQGAKMIQYVVSAEVAQYIMNGLSHLPWGVANPIILDLQRQADAQLNPAPIPAAAEPEVATAPAEPEVKPNPKRGSK